MTLPVGGQRIGPYEIVAKLGEGGMGVVYRATDTRLGRAVALKVLPDALGEDPERRARFDREAKTLASLNHPHIATLHALEEVDGRHVLVMELVEGEDLAQRIARGPVAVDEAAPIALQIAEALEAAHELGIVHRDLKPANVMVRGDGTVKVLDFGLAKALDVSADSRSGDPAHSPTLTAATQQGLILGTAAYMAPEQARGRHVDRRADIWAFGVVVFEMLTGARLFTGELVTDVLANVLKQEIDWGRLPASVPVELQRLLHRCLERDPKLRLRDIGEARVTLAGPMAAAAPEPPPVVVHRVPRRWTFAAVAAVALAAGAAAGFVAGRSASPVAARDLDLHALTFRRGTVLTARFAPDGRSVVYGAAWDGAPPDVFAVRLDSRESRSLGLSGADVLSVSSTGELAVSLGRRYTVGWESTGTLARRPIDSGSPRQVLAGIQDADWSPDGTALAVVRNVGAKRRLEYPIGHVLFETGGWISHPRVSRDGRLVAFLDHPNRGDNESSVKVVDAQGKVRQVASRASNGLAWSAGGDELLYPTGSALRRSTLSGNARVIFRTMGGVFLHDVSPQGDVLLSRTTMQREIVGAAPGSTHERNLSWLDWSFPTALSSDGRMVLFEEQNLATNGDYGLFLRPTDGAPPIRLGNGRGLAISRDGAWVLAASHAVGGSELVLMPTGPGETRRVGLANIVPSAAAFLPDGRRAVVAGHTASEGARLYLVDLTSGSSRPISPEGISDYFSSLVSPDGRTAFASGPDGTVTLYPIDGGEPRAVPGTTLDDIAISWTGDGRALLVLHGSALPARVERLDVATGGRTVWKELTPPDPAGVPGIGPVQVSADPAAYVYSYRRKLDQLFVVGGLR